MFSVAFCHSLLSQKDVVIDFYVVVFSSIAFVCTTLKGCHRLHHFHSAANCFEHIKRFDMHLANDMEKFDIDRKFTVSDDIVSLDKTLN